MIKLLSINFYLQTPAHLHINSCQGNISSTRINLYVVLCLPQHILYMYISICLFSCDCAYSVCPLLHLHIGTCMFVCSLHLSVSTACMHAACLRAAAVCVCVSFVSVHLYSYKRVRCWDLVVSSPSFIKNRVQSRDLGEGAVNSVSLVWKLPMGWAEAAGTEEGGSRQRGRKTCVHMLVSKKKEEMRRER